MANAYPAALAEIPELTSYSEELTYISNILEVYLMENGNDNLAKSNYVYAVSRFNHLALDTYL